MAVRDYDPGAVTLAWDGLDINGFAEGTFISFAMDTDAFTKVVGAQGDMTRVRVRNRGSRITFTLLQTSPDNDTLSLRHNRDIKGTAQKGPCTLKDNLGNTLIQAENAWLVKMPDAGFSADGDEGREWMLDLGETEATIGGSVT